MDRGLDEEKIYIKLFGHFEVNYAGETIFLGRNINNKGIRLFQILLIYRETGVSRQELIQYLFKDEEVANFSNSLRVNHYRMKKLLMNGGLPFEDYFIVQNGMYYWNKDIDLILDVDLF